MNRWMRILIAGSATLLIGACGEDRSSPVGPELEVRRSGVIIGGNDTRSDSTVTVQSTDSYQLQSDSTTEESSDGGVIIGGN